MNLGDYNGVAERLTVVCDYYLDLGAGLRDSEGRVEVWPCPQCGEASLTATFERGTTGCSNERCQVSASMELLELVAWLDPELDADDRQGAGQRFAHILEARLREEQAREQQRTEKRQRAREQKKWQKGQEESRTRKQGEIEDSLF